MVNCIKAVAKEGACIEYATHVGYVTSNMDVSVKCNVYYSYQYGNDIQ